MVYCTIPDYSVDTVHVICVILYLKSTIFTDFVAPHSAILFYHVCLSVRMSACPMSVSKRMHASSNYFDDFVGHHYSFVDPTAGAKYQGEPLGEALNIHVG